MLAFPVNLLSNNQPRENGFEMPGGLGKEVEAYLGGMSDGLVAHMMERCAGMQMRSAFEQNLMLADLVALEEFYVRGPRRNRKLLGEGNRTREWLAPEELLDLLVAKSGHEQ